MILVQCSGKNPQNFVFVSASRSQKRTLAKMSASHKKDGERISRIFLGFVFWEKQQISEVEASEHDRKQGNLAFGMLSTALHVHRFFFHACRLNLIFVKDELPDIHVLMSCQSPEYCNISREHSAGSESMTLMFITSTVSSYDRYNSAILIPPSHTADRPFDKRAGTSICFDLRSCSLTG